MDNIGYFLGYFFWYMTIMATGVYFLANSIGTRGAFSKAMVWTFLWTFQLFVGLVMTFFPFIHVWFVSHK